MALTPAHNRDTEDTFKLWGFNVWVPGAQVTVTSNSLIRPSPSPLLSSGIHH